MIKNMNDVILTPLKKIENAKGNIYHIIRSFDEGFKGFGEAYISLINQNEIKAWKKHFQMTANFVVPAGKIKFVVAGFDEERNEPTDFREFILSLDNYCRLTIPPNLWYGFKGLGENPNMIINVADIAHDPHEQVNEELNFIKYNW